MFSQLRAQPPNIPLAAAGIALVTLLAVPAQAAAAPPVDHVDTPTPATGHAALQVTPGTLHLTVESGQQRQRVLTLANTGPAAVTWRIAEGGDSMRPPAAGQILKSWPVTNLAVGWGIGIESGNVWVSDVDLLRNDSFTVDGAPRDEGWPTPWAAGWPSPADMAYVPDRAAMCQVNVGGDNGVYCWDPRTGDVVATIVGDFPWTTTSQRGLAYRPDDDTFYIGGWNQGIIYRIGGLSHAHPGSVISQCSPADPAISGLGWSPETGRLWVATNSADDLIYSIDPNTCATLSTLTPPDQAPSTGGGLDVDADGNLWLMSAGSGGAAGPSGTAYLVSSGLAHFSDVPWLSVTPGSGVLPREATQRVTVRVDATGLDPGRYAATLYLLGDTGKPVATIPVQLRVRCC